jgi:hypothetical protein
MPAYMDWVRKGLFQIQLVGPRNEYRFHNYWETKHPVASGILWKWKTPGLDAKRCVSNAVIGPKERVSIS